MEMDQGFNDKELQRIMENHPFEDDIKIILPASRNEKMDKTHSHQMQLVPPSTIRTSI